MNKGTDDAKHGEGGGTASWERWMSCGPSGPTAASCCGTDTQAMSEGWPCRTIMKEHRFAIFAGLSGVALTILIGLTGFILGIIAFFRTL